MSDRRSSTTTSGSPYAYLAAERVNSVLAVVPEWQPILLGGIWQRSGGDSWSRTDARERGHGRDRAPGAAEYGLPADPLARPVAGRTPLTAMRAATFAKQTRPRRGVLAGRVPAGLRRRPRPVATPTTC